MVGRAIDGYLPQFYNELCLALKTKCLPVRSHQPDTLDCDEQTQRALFGLLRHLGVMRNLKLSSTLLFGLFWDIAQKAS